MRQSLRIIHQVCYNYIYGIFRLGGPYSEKCCPRPQPEGNILKPEVTIFQYMDQPFFPAVNWLTSWFVYAILWLNWLTCRQHIIVKCLMSERTSIIQILGKERCIKEQIFFKLLYVSSI